MSMVMEMSACPLTALKGTSKDLGTYREPVKIDMEGFNSRAFRLIEYKMCCHILNPLH